MTTPDFRALLADDAYAASFQSVGQYRTALLKALATPPPEPPTDEELRKLWLDLYATNDGPTSGEVVTIARAVLQRWGTSQPEPPEDDDRWPHL